MRTDELDSVKAYERLNFLYENLDNEQTLLFNRVKNYKANLIDASKAIDALF
jgi:ribosome assembly protein YihI (activator of Der GTPase)